MKIPLSDLNRLHIDLPNAWHWILKPQKYQLRIVIFQKKAVFNRYLRLLKGKS